MEILFKAKRYDNKEWIEGDLLSYSRLHCPAIVSSPMSEPVNVDPETICIYTGKDDSEGNKIFHRDLIETVDTRTGEKYVDEIVWEDCCFWRKNIETGELYEGLGFLQEDEHAIVIGSAI